MEKQNKILTEDFFSEIEAYLKDLNITYRVKGNNFYVFSLEDYYKIEDEQLLKNLWIDNYKIDKISFLGKKITIYTIDNEYVKIIFEWTVLETIKYHLLNLFGK